MGVTKPLRSPTPRRAVRPEVTLRYPTGRRAPLPAPPPASHGSALEVLSARQSLRTFGALPRAKLAQFLWHSARTRFSYRDRTGRLHESRPAPSAGACHPHDLLIVQAKARGLSAQLYDPRTHALTDLRVGSRALRALIQRVAQALPIGGGTLIWLVGHPPHTERYYENAESLLWRDAGVLLGVMAVAAEALDLSLCALGMTGDPEITRLFGAKQNVRGFGGVILGTRRRARARPS
jgi:SagB-type dehydrogenase family enzyme